MEGRTDRQQLDSDRRRSAQERPEGRTDRQQLDLLRRDHMEDDGSSSPALLKQQPHSPAMFDLIANTCTPSFPLPPAFHDHRVTGSRTKRQAKWIVSWRTQARCVNEHSMSDGTVDLFSGHQMNLMQTTILILANRKVNDDIRTESSIPESRKQCGSCHASHWIQSMTVIMSTVFRRIKELSGCCC